MLPILDAAVPQRNPEKDGKLAPFPIQLFINGP